MEQVMRGTTRYSDEELAAYCHDQTMALQRLQDGNGHIDQAPAVPWASFPEEYRQITIRGVRRVRNGTTTREHQAAWVTEMEDLGWKKGPKDRAAMTHPDLIQYDEMTQHQRDKVRMFISAVVTLTLEE
jgi:hypothetical protein